MKFTKMKLNFYDEVWISGIYEVVKYRNKEYQAYYLRDDQKNWGDHAGNPQNISIYGHKCYHTLKAAKKACETHATTHTPAQATIKRAAEVVEANGRNP